MQTSPWWRWFVLGGAFAASVVGQDVDDAATDLDRRMMLELRGRHGSPHARFHYDPDAIALGDRDAAVADVEAGFAALERRLDMRYRGRILVFLYADHEDLERRTGSDAVAFSTGTVSLHQPHDFRGLHELTHLFALQFPRTQDSVSDPFVVEGLATILAGSDDGVPIHGWAAVYRRAGRLPDLVALRRTFPEGAPRGVHPYHVAGSFVGFLIDRFGMPAVKSWYVNSTEAQHWFGKPFRALEREWREWLDGLDVEPAHRARVLARLGLSPRELPAAVRAANGVDLLAGQRLEALDRERGDCWSIVDGVLRGAHDGPWTHVHSNQAFGPNVAVRARLRLVTGNAVKLRCNRAERVDEAILATWATYLGSGEGYVSSEPVVATPGVWHDVVLVHEDGSCVLFFDGIAVLEAAGAPSSTRGSVGIAVEKGTVELTSFEVFEW